MLKLELDEDEQRIIVEALKFWFDKVPERETEAQFDSHIHDYLTCHSLIETITESGDF